ncbi:RNA-binding transcriptional accessory protein [Psychromonas sp. RZ22]|uniref:helix-hairpin-helix domain-containing protein n=1 Tax=Psychromonas algarum TaxID=2555643 RepID=UPI001067E49F|nr:Tex family protein [Psychromonas sp. RZ22]TEW55924.1 RNA-binding transcriptional accessory protein [Psychromonas sp. RZ22]
MPSTSKITEYLAQECHISFKQADSAIKLLDDGNTVPFIARYRKHLTQSLGDNQLRLLETKLHYFRELETRKVSILKSIDSQGKLTKQLQTQIQSIQDKVSLEHCYAPFKTTRVSKAKLAEEAGLMLLAKQLWQSPKQQFNRIAGRYINASKGFVTPEQALEGALAIAVENITQDVELLTLLKKHLGEQSVLTAVVVKSKINAAIKYKDYFDFSAKLNQIPAHRVLAMLRGKSEGFLRLKINADPFQKDKKTYSYCQTLMAKHLNIYLAKDDHDSWHRKVIDTAWRTKLLLNLEKQFLVQLKEQADNEAIEQFANNLTSLLMAAPAGEKVTLGLDPGFKSGCKLAIIDKTGKLLDYATIYPHQPQRQIAKAIQQVSQLIKQYKVELIAIGNGTASRESEQFIAEILQSIDLPIKAISVSEAGASVYSASQLAAEEFPNLDVTVRGAVSIARRLQDPLSELVKIEAKAIGVGLYQHDVQQTLLANRLQAVVEDCVNKIGVDLNTASAHLLSHVAGLNTTIANNIVEYRDLHGRFNSRQALNNVNRLGAKAFQQAAGFLTVNKGENGLDETILHPEQYLLTKEFLLLNKITVEQVLASPETCELNIPEDMDKDKVIAYREISNVLKQVRRDPRAEFKSAEFDQNIQKITDLSVGMALQGAVTNVANFGAFVDLGVHQDGLIHISMLKEGFVDDPQKVVKVGQIVNVEIISVDTERKRIALTMKSIKQPSI